MPLCPCGGRGRAVAEQARLPASPGISALPAGTGRCFVSNRPPGQVVPDAQSGQATPAAHWYPGIHPPSPPHNRSGRRHSGVGCPSASCRPQLLVLKIAEFQHLVLPLFCSEPASKTRTASNAQPAAPAAGPLPPPRLQQISSWIWANKLGRFTARILTWVL